MMRPVGGGSPSSREDAYPVERHAGVPSDQGESFHLRLG